MQNRDLLHVEERTLDTQFGDDVINIGIVSSGKIALHVEHEAHLVGQRQSPLDLARRGRKTLVGKPLAGGAHGTTGRNLLTKPVETYFLLECGRVNHEELKIKN